MISAPPPAPAHPGVTGPPFGDPTCPRIEHQCTTLSEGKYTRTRSPRKGKSRLSEDLVDKKLKRTPTRTQDSEKQPRGCHHRRRACKSRLDVKNAPPTNALRPCQNFLEAPKLAPGSQKSESILSPTADAAMGTLGHQNVRLRDARKRFQALPCSLEGGLTTPKAPQIHIENQIP